MFFGVDTEQTGNMKVSWHSPWIDTVSLVVVFLLLWSAEAWVGSHHPQSFRTCTRIQLLMPQCRQTARSTVRLYATTSTTTKGPSSSNNKTHSSVFKPAYRPPVSSSGSSKFAQPAFAASTVQRRGDRKTTTTTKKKKNLYGGDSSIASRHTERLKTAGREGTKRYQNPNKVFVGNLPFHVTSSDLEDWIGQHFAVPAPLLLKQCKVVHDWQTQKSKGYGFAVFTEPIYATVLLEKCRRGSQWQGRRLTVSAGYKKQPDPKLYVQQKLQKAKDRQERAIQEGIQEASPSTTKRPRMDPEEAYLLQRLDPDLIDQDDDDDDDNEEYDLDDDDDFSGELEEDVDGYWTGDDDDEEEEDMALDEGAPMNRQRRREASRQKKKRKTSDKGFG